VYLHPTVQVILSPLNRVIGVGKVVEVRGIPVELLAIEIRAAGAIVHWRARTVDDQMLWGAAVALSDDRGTTYQLADVASEADSVRWTGQSFHIPAPPIGARLHLELVAFGPQSDHEVPGGASKQQIVGPWSFDVLA
jgi:hypothetical protein